MAVATQRRCIGTKGDKPRFRGGHIPEAPEFKGEVDPMIFKRWLRRINIWQKRVRDYLPLDEQGLALLEKISGPAIDILDVIIEDRGDLCYAVDDGVEKIIADLKPHFEEKHFIRKTEVMAEYETMKRKPGESLHQYI